MARRMSSPGTSRRDPARVPSVVLRNRILVRSRLPVLIVLLAIGYGTVGYWLVEGKNLLDAFYETVLTLRTPGVGAGPPPGPGGKLFTVSLILFGVVALFTAIGVGTEVVASGELGRWLRMNQATRSISHLSGHYVICAYGRVGRAVMEELRRRNYTSVVIESKPELEPLLEEHGVRYLPGDPADESVLRQAGIERARGLICAVDSDAANVFITLTARALNPDLRIVARASERASIDKLVRAGADEVVPPARLPSGCSPQTSGAAPPGPISLRWPLALTASQRCAAGPAPPPAHAQNRAPPMAGMAGGAMVTPASTMLGACFARRSCAMRGRPRRGRARTGQLRSG
jgi:TrkA family protein/ion channel